LLPVAFAYCGPQDLAASLTPTFLETIEGRPVNGTFVITANTSRAVAAVTFPDGRIASFTFDENFSFIAPSDRDSFRALFSAISDDGCVVSRLATFTIFHPPTLTVEPDLLSLTVVEGRPTLFTATANATIAWRLDNGSEILNDTFLFQPTFSDAGKHLLTVIATDVRNLSTSRNWSLVVTDVDRPPFLVAPLFDINIPVGNHFSFDLRDHIVDPDMTPLTFSFSRVDPPPPLQPAGLDARIDGSFVLLEAYDDGKTFFRFTATSTNGARFESAPVLFTVIPAVEGEVKDYCGDGFCIETENCSSCTKDCGECAEPCAPLWHCIEWTACQPTGFQTRVCAPLTACMEDALRPAESRSCRYNATCTDGLKNGEERGVDCGGPCSSCPSCFDGVMNGGEFGVDCGGSCVPCPSCDDGLKNQGESDVDCSGPCAPCGVDKTCKILADCESLRCVDARCLVATCDDQTSNQGERGVDCGGPCAPCPSCSDGIKNGEERGVDCGGSCVACPSCSDGLKNQGERFTDCGGPCSSCGLRSYLPLLFDALILCLLFILFAVGLFWLRAVVSSRLIFLMQNGKTIHFFYEDPPTYCLVRCWSRLSRPFRTPSLTVSSIDETLHELFRLRVASAETLRSAIIGKLRALYAELFGLPINYELATLVNAVKNSPLPFSTKVIVLRNTKLLALLETTKLYGDGTYALSEATKGLEELRKALR